MTWFNKDKRINWIDVTNLDLSAIVEKTTNKIKELKCYQKKEFLISSQK